jgi:hypothetical protein
VSFQDLDELLEHVAIPPSFNLWPDSGRYSEHIIAFFTEGFKYKPGSSGINIASSDVWTA